MRWTRAAGRALLVVAVVLAGYAGFGVGAPDGVASGGRGPMTLATAGDLTGYLSPLLDDWNAGHPGERVTLVELPDSADETRAQMISELRSGGNRFDLLNIDVAWTSEFAAAGWISPLDRARFPLDAFLRPVVDTATFDGRLYAVPYVTNAGLLYYRKDVLDEEGEQPPRTWADLIRQARTIAPKHGLDGYAYQFLPYEGLTVNVTEAVNSAGGSILRDDGARVTVDSGAARVGLRFLADGVRDGWISRDALGYKEEESRQAFQDGRLLFLRNWPYVYADSRRGEVEGRGQVRRGAAARAGRARLQCAGRLQPGRQQPLPASGLGGRSDLLPDERTGPAQGADRGLAPTGARRALRGPRAAPRLSLPGHAPPERAVGGAAPEERPLRPGEPGRTGRGAGPDGAARDA